MSTVASSSENTSNRGNFFLNPELGQRLDLIRHLLANTKNIPFVLAPEGSGKTRLNHFLADSLKEHYRICAINAGEITGTPDLKVLIAQTANIPIDQSVTDAVLINGLQQLKKDRKPVLMLLDDVDQLAAEPLAWLLGFFNKTEVHSQGKLVIFSALDLLALPLSPMDINQYRDNVQILDIPAYSRQQVIEFIKFISKADAELIPEDRLDQIYKESSGRPGKIIWQLKFAAAQNQSAKVSQTKPMLHKSSNPLIVIGIIVLLSALGTLIVFQEQINEFVAQKKEPVAEEKLETLNLPEQEKPVSVALPIPEKPVEKLDSIKELEKAIAEKPEQPAIKIEIEKPVEEPIKKEVADQQVPVVQAEPEVIQIPKQQESLANKPEVKIEPVTEEKPAVKVEPKPKPVSKPEPVADPEGYQSVAWLMSKPDSYYVLQLVAVSNEKAIREFVRKHNLDGDKVILETSRKGKPWFSLLYGAYKTKKLAVTARDQLPKTFNSSSAWPRTIGSIKKQQ